MQQSGRTFQANRCDRAEECARNVSKLAEAAAQIQRLVEANRRLRAELAQTTLLWVDARNASRFDLAAARREVESRSESVDTPRPHMVGR
jgi:hypothetical protein